MTSRAMWIGVVIVWWLSAIVHSLRADEPQPAEPAGPLRAEFAIALHGGAGASPERWSSEQRQAYERSLRRALQIGYDILKDGGSSLDAVESVVRCLEDDPLFNAGRGAVFNAEGRHELDASIMDGRTMACGAVAGVSTVRNPISLARLVMTETPHVLLAGPGAERFADQQGIPRVDPHYFWTERRYRAWKESRPADDESPRGTVGCVALDRRGNLAAGTSTGGLTGKMPGRVGDSPIIGAGTYADNRTCAVSCTGIGEHFIRYAIAYDVSALMAYKQWPLEKAVHHVVHEKLKPGWGGLIAVGRDGAICMQFNTEGMPRAAADWRGRFEVKLGR